MLAMAAIGLFCSEFLIVQLLLFKGSEYLRAVSIWRNIVTVDLFSGFHHLQLLISYNMSVQREKGACRIWSLAWTINQPYKNRLCKSHPGHILANTRLIGCTGVTGRWGLLSHAQNAVRWLALSKGLVEAFEGIVSSTAVFSYCESCSQENFYTIFAASYSMVY